MNKNHIPVKILFIRGKWNLDVTPTQPLLLPHAMLIFHLPTRFVDRLSSKQEASVKTQLERSQEHTCSLSYTDLI